MKVPGFPLKVSILPTPFFMRLFHSISLDSVLFSKTYGLSDIIFHETCLGLFSSSGNIEKIRGIVYLGEIPVMNEGEKQT